MLIFVLVANNYNGVLKATNELVVFMLELLMLVVFGWYGYRYRYDSNHYTNHQLLYRTTIKKSV